MILVTKIVIRIQEWQWRYVNWDKNDIISNNNNNSNNEEINNIINSNNLIKTNNNSKKKIKVKRVMATIKTIIIAIITKVVTCNNQNSNK